MPQPLSSFYLRTGAPAPSPVWCPACEHVNPEGARYCNACGARTDLRECPACESINDAAATQCYKCGLMLAARDAGRAAAGASPDPVPAASAGTVFPNLAPLRECPHCEALNDATAALCYRCESSFVDVIGDTAPIDLPHDRSDERDDAAPAVAESPAPRSSTGPAPPQTADGPGLAGEDDIASAANVGASFIAHPDPRKVAGEPNVLLEDDASLHYVGTLTAPLDEAELPHAEIPAVEPKRGRGAWVLAGMVLLIVVPAGVAGALYTYQDPAALERAVSIARDTLARIMPLADTPEATPAPPGAVDSVQAPAPQSASPEVMGTGPAVPPAVSPDATAVAPASHAPGVESASPAAPAEPSAMAPVPNLASLQAAAPAANAAPRAKSTPRTKAGGQRPTRSQSSSRSAANNRLAAQRSRNAKR